uniref:Uncharacterized protein n=1 Tax=Pseudo-nitzschia australis TaxID=44445 RepID=A0A7S4AET7_9STRA
MGQNVPIAPSIQSSGIYWICMVFAEIKSLGINVSIPPRIQRPTRQHTGSIKVQQKSSIWKMGAASKTFLFKERVVEQPCLASGIYWICMVFAEIKDRRKEMGINV